MAGDEGKAGIAPGRAPGLPRARPGPRHRPDDDAAVQRGSRGQPAPLRGPRRARRSARPDPPFDGHVAGFRGRRRRRLRPSYAWEPASTGHNAGDSVSSANRIDGYGATRLHARHCSSTSASPRTATRTKRRRSTPASPSATSRSATASGRTSAASPTRRRRDEIDDIFADDTPAERRTTRLRSVEPQDRRQRRPPRELARPPRDPRSPSTTPRTSRTSSRTRSR